MRKFLAFALFISSSLTVFAQSGGQIVSAFVPILDETNTTEVTHLPLPPGEWLVVRSTIRSSGRSSNGAPSKLRDVSLLRIDSNRVVGAIEISSQIDNTTRRWRDEPCKATSVNYKNDFGSNLWIQKCITVNYSTFLQNNNPIARATLEDLAQRNITHDYNGFRITFTKFGDSSKYLAYRQFIFPSVFGLDNPRINNLTASPYHPDSIKSHSDKNDFVSALSQYAESITPLLDQAYLFGSRTALPGFSFTPSKFSIKESPRTGEAPPPQDQKGNEGNLVRHGYGTGFYINKLGDLVTNYHVIRDALNIVILNHDKTVSRGRVIASDIANDLAVVRAEKSPASYLPLMRSEDAKRGEKVFTLGFPNPNIQGRSIKYTDGSISATAGILDQPTKFQISVPIQPGNSGGPLIDADGNVIGVVVAKLNAEAALKSSGSLPENINYAVKSNYLIELLRSSQTQFTLGKTATGTAKNSADIAASAEKAVVLIGIQTNQNR